MELTKKQAIEEHRKMWTWIAERIKKYSVRELKSFPDWTNVIIFLKQSYTLNMKISILNNCFCCEYTRMKMGEDFYCYPCGETCPLVWGGNNSIGCMGAEYGTFESLKRISTKNKEIAYQRALKIANLPEKEERSESTCE